MNSLIVTIIKSIASPKFLVWIRRDFPAAYFAVAFIFGNASFSLFPLTNEIIIIFFVFNLVLIFFRHWRSFSIFIFLGYCSALPLQFQHKAPQLKRQHVLIKSVSRTSYKNVGAISFVAEVHPLRVEYGTEHQAILKLSQQKPYRLVCSGIDLPWEGASHIKKGQILLAVVDIKPLPKFIKPLDYSAAEWRKGIQGKCTIRIITREIHQEHSIIENFRSELVIKARNVLGDNEATSMVLAMSLGTRDGLSTRSEQAIRQLGLTHILVVSGYHFSLIFGLILLLGKLLKFILPAYVTNHTNRRLALLIAILLMLAYATLVGESVSTTRALFALICLIGGLFFERGYSLVNTIVIALAALCIIWPGTIFEIGTQFTFLALFGIAIALSISQVRIWPTWMTVPIFATLTTQLISLLWFKQIACWTLLANILLVPPAALLICNLGLVGLLILSCSHFIGLLIIYPAWLAAGKLIECAWWIQSLNFGFYEIDQSTSIILVIVISTILFIYWLESMRNYLQVRRIFDYPNR